jgi:pimeloyl-ACP methyl ester carboxylesterase
LRFYPTDQGTMACSLELHDPLVARVTQVGLRPVPLETDLTTPLAYFLDTPEISRVSQLATMGLLNPNQLSPRAGLFMVEPYDPNKIPVLLVHGLWSSPLTWMEMFNDLRSFPEIREHYQFWFYLYPTGQPFWVSAAQLRRDLEALQRTLDPQQEAAALRHMVLAGHSMGGLVSRLQVIESRDDFWRIISDRPLDQIEAGPEDRESLAEVVFFSPNPNIRRVITIGTPHRGSHFANSYTRWLGRNLIRLPTMLVSRNERLIRQNPGAFHNTDLLTITTSIDSLSPKSPILPVMQQAQRAAWVHEHNIIGVVSDEGLVGRLAAESDGVVHVDHARLAGAESEMFVTADHMSVHQHPRAILEIRRILLDNLEDYYREVEGRSSPVSHLNE